MALARFIAIPVVYFERPMKSDFYAQPTQNLNSSILLLHGRRIRGSKVFLSFQPPINEGDAFGFPH
jgi:hypothetical protein